MSRLEALEEEERTAQLLVQKHVRELRDMVGGITELVAVGMPPATKRLITKVATLDEATAIWAAIHGNLQQERIRVERLPDDLRYQGKGGVA